MQQQQQYTAIHQGVASPHGTVRRKKLFKHAGSCKHTAERMLSRLFEVCCPCPIRVSPHLQEPLLAAAADSDLTADRIEALEARVSALEAELRRTARAVEGELCELRHAVQREASRVHARLDLYEAKLCVFADATVDRVEQETGRIIVETLGYDFLSAFGDQIAHRVEQQARQEVLRMLAERYPDCFSCPYGARQ